MSNLTPVEEVLAHFGVKGMKWGVRNAASGARAAGRSAAGVVKEINRPYRDEDQAISTARTGYTKVKADYGKAKAQYREEKKIIGRKAAKPALRAARNAHYKNWELATRMTSGERATETILRMFGADGYQSRWDIANKLDNNRR